MSEPGDVDVAILGAGAAGIAAARRLIELGRRVLVSVHDYARYAGADSGINWRVAEGYGSLVARLGAALPVQLGSPVRHVDHRGRSIIVEAARGSVRARAVLVTLPPSVLAVDAV